MPAPVDVDTSFWAFRLFHADATQPLCAYADTAHTLDVHADTNISL